MKKTLIKLSLCLPLFFVSCSSTSSNTSNGSGGGGGYFSAEKVKERHLERMAKLNGTPRPSSAGGGETLDEIRERGRLENNKVARETTNPYINQQKP